MSETDGKKTESDPSAWANDEETLQTSVKQKPTSDKYQQVNVEEEASSESDSENPLGYASRRPRVNRHPSAQADEEADEAEAQGSEAGRQEAIPVPEDSSRRLETSPVKKGRDKKNEVIGRNDPRYTPKSALHDDRGEDNPVRSRQPPRKTAADTDLWRHDMFESDDQGPRSHHERDYVSSGGYKTRMRARDKIDYSNLERRAREPQQRSNQPAVPPVDEEARNQVSEAVAPKRVGGTHSPVIKPGVNVADPVPGTVPEGRSKPGSSSTWNRERYRDFDEDYKTRERPYDCPQYGQESRYRNDHRRYPNSRYSGRGYPENRDHYTPQSFDAPHPESNERYSRKGPPPTYPNRNQYGGGYNDHQDHGRYDSRPRGDVRSNYDSAYTHADYRRGQNSYHSRDEYDERQNPEPPRRSGDRSHTSGTQGSHANAPVEGSDPQLIRGQLPYGDSESIPNQQGTLDNPTVAPKDGRSRPHQSTGFSSGSQSRPIPDNETTRRPSSIETKQAISREPERPTEPVQMNEPARKPQRFSRVVEKQEFASLESSGAGKIVVRSDKALPGDGQKLLDEKPLGDVRVELSLLELQQLIAHFTLNEAVKQQPTLSAAHPQTSVSPIPMHQYPPPMPPHGYLPYPMFYPGAPTDLGNVVIPPVSGQSSLQMPHIEQMSNLPPQNPLFPFYSYPGNYGPGFFPPSHAILPQSAWTANPAEFSQTDSTTPAPKK